MKSGIIAAVAVLAASLCGCATIIEGSSQKIGVTTSPVSGASCVLTNERGSWTLTSPGLIVVKRSTTDLAIVCKKDGFGDGIGTLHSRTSDGASATALLLGPIGLGVDAATGATFHYPDGIDIPMRPAAPVTADLTSPAP